MFLLNDYPFWSLGKRDNWDDRINAAENTHVIGDHHISPPSRFEIIQNILLLLYIYIYTYIYTYIYNHIYIIYIYYKYIYIYIYTPSSSWSHHPQWNPRLCGWNQHKCASGVPKSHKAWGMIAMVIGEWSYEWLGGLLIPCCKYI